MTLFWGGSGVQEPSEHERGHKQKHSRKKDIIFAVDQVGGGYKKNIKKDKTPVTHTDDNK